MSGVPLPSGASRPALSLAAVAFALFGIARTTGSGWLIVVLTGIASVVVLATLLPPWGLRRIEVRIQPPRDGTVGRTAELDVEVAGGAGGVVKLALRDFGGEWTGVSTPAAGKLAVVPTRRGVHTTAAVEVRSAAPLGLVWWRRRVIVELPRPFEVGPAPAPVRLDAPMGRGDDGAESGQATSAMADAVKTVREYTSGDPIKLVHWTATARAGELMVKELESPASPALVIAVDLRGGDDEAVEAAASRAAGLALAALAAGYAVELLTAEATGPRRGPVGAPGDVNRRLARAVPGALPAPPAGTTPLVVAA